MAIGIVSVRNVTCPSAKAKFRRRCVWKSCAVELRPVRGRRDPRPRLGVQGVLRRAQAALVAPRVRPDVVRLVCMGFGDFAHDHGRAGAVCHVREFEQPAVDEHAVVVDLDVVVDALAGAETATDEGVGRGGRVHPRVVRDQRFAVVLREDAPLQACLDALALRLPGRGAAPREIVDIERAVEVLVLHHRQDLQQAACPVPVRPRIGEAGTGAASAHALVAADAAGEDRTPLASW